MSTEQGSPQPPQPPPQDLNTLLGAVPPSPKDETIASLETEIQGIKEKLNEERFLWTLVIIVLVDIYVFSGMENWAGPLVIGVLELVGIAILADRCGVDTVAPLIDRLTGFAHRAAKTARDSD